jgi:hypothetical protein
MRRTRFTCLGLLLAACTGRRTAGTNSYADVDRDCRSAATLLAPGGGFSPHMAPPLWRVRACPARAGEILAVVVQETRSVADTGRLEAATWLAQYVHDARILAAGIAVATDSGAAPEARVAALRVLLWAKAPGHLVPLHAMVSGPPCRPPRCVSSYTGHFYRAGPIAGDTTTWPVFGTPMPPAYVAQIDSVASLIEGSSTAPPIVRQAARVTRAFPPDRELEGR